MAMSGSSSWMPYAPLEVKGLYDDDDYVRHEVSKHSISACGLTVTCVGFCRALIRDVRSCSHTYPLDLEMDI